MKPAYIVVWLRKPSNGLLKKIWFADMGHLKKIMIDNDKKINGKIIVELYAK